MKFAFPSLPASRLFFLFLLAATCVVLLPHTGFAYDETAGGAVSNNQVCPGDGLMQRVMPCLSKMIASTTTEFFEKLYPAFETIIDLALLLAVVFLGVMLAIGAVERASTEVFIFLIKFGAIIYFTSNLEMIYDWLVGRNGSDGIIYQLINIVSTFDVGGNSLRCDTGHDIVSVWKRVDCVINGLIGISTSGPKGFGTLANGMLSFLFSSLVSGAVGIVIFIVGVYMCFNITMGLLRACIIYLISLMMITVVLLSGMIFIPLLIFKSSGMQFFNNWIRILGAVILQPVIVFAFLNVMLVALDILVYSGDNSVFRTMVGDAVDKPDFSMNLYMEDNNLYTNKQGQLATANLSPRTTAQKPTEPTTPFGSGGNNPTATEPANHNDPAVVKLGVEYRTIDFDAMAKARKGNPELPSKDAKGMMQALTSAILLAGFVSYLLVQLLGVIPRLAQDLSGGIKQVPDIASLGRLPGEGIARQGVTGVARQFEGLLTNRKVI